MGSFIVLNIMLFLEADLYLMSGRIAYFLNRFWLDFVPKLKKKIIFIPTKYRQKNILVVDTLLSFILTHPSVLEKSYSVFHA